MEAAWVLNFDAEDELASPRGYGALSVVMRARIRTLEAHGRALLGPGDVVVRDGETLASPRLGRAWCPTPSALERLRRAGAIVPDAPPLEVLQRVNHRRFCAELGQTLPDAAYATSLDDVTRVLAARAGVTWLLKRPFGFAGRGRRKVTAGRLDDPDRAFLAATLRTWGGVQVEPWVLRERDFALHGHVDATGEIVLGAPTVQRVDAHGAWIASEVARDLELADAERDALVEEARASGRALATAGYFGPFGVDAYRWRDASGARFNARSEINARYSMGWAVGMRGWLPR